MKCLLKYQDLEDNEDAVTKHSVGDDACRDTAVALSSLNHYIPRYWTVQVLNFKFKA